jgi:hypothetical protein
VTIHPGLAVGLSGVTASCELQEDGRGLGFGDPSPKCGLPKELLGGGRDQRELAS